MSEFCPKTGMPCPVDKAFDRFEQTYSTDPTGLQTIQAIKLLVEQRRANVPCDGIFTEQVNLQTTAEHCGSHAGPEIQRITSVVGEAFGFEPEEYTGITVSEIR